MPEDRINLWKEKGVVFVFNGDQTKHALHLQFYIDCIEHKERLDIQKRKSSIPQLIVMETQILLFW